MKIIAFNEGHCASVVYLKDGEIIDAYQEERFVRIKNKYGFPLNAFKYLLSKNDLDVNDIDKFVLVSDFLPINIIPDREKLIKSYKIKTSFVKKNKKVFSKKIGIKLLATHYIKNNRLATLFKLGVPMGKISFIDHHLAHASAAYFGYGVFDEKVLILTNDGAGDDLCATVSIGEQGNITKIASVHMDHSIGGLWALMTAMFGMVPLEHEYKLMGLAPYAPEDGKNKAKKVFHDCFVFEKDGLTWKISKGTPVIENAYEFLRDKLEFMRFDWIAAGLQEFTEEFLSLWVKNAISKTGIRKVVLSGGTFMNVKANKIIMELNEVEDLFVFPSCGDETNPMGAVYYEYYNATKRYPVPISSLSLGREWTDDEIIESFNKYKFNNKYTIEKAGDIIETSARLVAEGNVVAWFQGREEFGARALGNRSLLADPTKKNVIKEINEMIKSRDFWMPFAVSVLDVDEKKYIINPKNIPAPYMILTFDTTEMIGEVEAGTHPYDLTCRPQVVYRDWNEKYYNLLACFKSITGRGALLNTSFNLHGLPIASSPEDAFLVLEKSGLNYLAIGNYLIRKNE